MRLLLTQGVFFTSESASCLRAAGFGVDQFEEHDIVGEALATTDYNLALLECSKHLDWTSWLKRYRRPSTTGLIVLAAAEEERRIKALEAGADDCVGRLLSEKELVARVRAILRRPRGVVEQVVTAGNISLDCTSREVSVGGDPVAVPAMEVKIMELIMRRPGRIVTRCLLESDLYGAASEVGPNSVEARVSSLRRRLKSVGADVTICNVRGVGYRLTQLQDAVTRVAATAGIAMLSSLA